MFERAYGTFGCIDTMIVSFHLLELCFLQWDTLFHSCGCLFMHYIKSSLTVSHFQVLVNDCIYPQCLCVTPVIHGARNYAIGIVMVQYHDVFISRVVHDLKFSSEVSVNCNHDLLTSGSFAFLLCLCSLRWTWNVFWTVYGWLCYWPYWLIW